MKMLIRIFSLVILYVLAVQSTTVTQIKDPVRWEYKASRNDMEATLYFKAGISKGWHLYSTVTPEGGPVATEIKITPHSSFKLVGKIVEPTPVTRYDSGFDMKVKYFNDEVIFSQKVKLNSKSSTTISGTITYMVCDDEKCLPPADIEFNIAIPPHQ